MMGFRNYATALVLASSVTGLACQTWQSARDDAATISVPENVVLSFVDGQDVGDVRGSDDRTVRLDPGSHSLGFLVTNQIGTVGGLWQLSHSAACFSTVDMRPSGSYRLAYHFAAERFRAGAIDASPEFSARVEDATTEEPVGTTYCAHAPNSTPWRTCELAAGFPRPKKMYTPDYPNDAMMAGASGFIVVEGKVDSRGRILIKKRNPRIVDSSDFDLFGSSPFGGVTFLSGLETLTLWNFELGPEAIAGKKYSLRCEYRHPASQPASAPLE